jgi:hypothetical protein
MVVLARRRAAGYRRHGAGPLEERTARPNLPPLRSFASANEPGMIEGTSEAVSTQRSERAGFGSEIPMIRPP